MERYPSWSLSEWDKTLQKHNIIAFKHVCNSTFIKEESPTKNSKSQPCHVTWHPPPMLPDDLPAWHINNQTHLLSPLRIIICCVLPSWRIFYFKSSIYDLEPTLYISHAHKTNRKCDQFILFLTFYIPNILQMTEIYTHKRIAGITHVYLYNH